MTTNAGIAVRQDTSSLSAHCLVRACLDISSPFGLPQQQKARSAAITITPLARIPAGTAESMLATPSTIKITESPRVHDPPAEIPTVTSRAHMALRAAVFERLLAKHPDPYLRLVISVTLHRGADLRYRKPQKGRSLHQKSQSARIYYIFLALSIRKEVSPIHSIGPFHSRPLPHFVINALGAPQEGAKTPNHPRPFPAYRKQCE